MIEKVRSLEARPSGFFLCENILQKSLISTKDEKLPTEVILERNFFLFFVGLYVVGANKWSMITDHYSSMPTMRRERANHSP